jgi:DNA helicase II / ATP-dependent DNA helicase PcrA
MKSSRQGERTGKTLEAASIDAPRVPSPKLSSPQLRAVQHRGSDLQIIACAGSGKTETVAQRVATLIDEDVSPDAIVAFTFTERAALELKDRILKRVKERKGAAFLDRLGPMYVGTIHGYCFRLLQDYVPKYGNYDVLDEHRHAGILAREFFALGLTAVFPGRTATADFIRTVDVIGNELIDVAKLHGTPLGDCVQKYLEMLERYHFLTFGMIITKAVEALGDPKVFKRVTAPLRHLIVDEYQDINPAQQHLIALLAKPPVQLTVVGDDDQAIYQWRGSDVRHIVNFAAERGAVHSESLDTNRRSRPAIIASANAFAHSIPNRLEKEMKPYRLAASNEVVTWMAETDVEEAETIAQHIKALHEQGYAYRDIAVLFRSVRTAAPPLLDACQRLGIPVACGGRTGLFLQEDVAAFGELFAWVLDKDWRDGRYEAFRPSDIDRIVSYFMSAFDVQRPEAEVRRYFKDWKTHCRQGAKPVSLVGHFYRHLYFLGAFRINLDTPEGSARFGALARFSELLADFEHVTRRGRYVVENGERVFRGGRDRGTSYLESLYRYLVYYARDAYEDFPGEPAADLDAVDILTVHQAKGLEWPVVFIPSLVSRRFPSFRAGTAQRWFLPDEVLSDETRRRYEGGDAEERRLFYVALTRARDCAYLSAFKRITNTFKPSPYLKEVAGGKVPPVRNSLPLPPLSKGEDTEVPPLEISFSDYALFEDCGHRYRLGSLLGFQQELAVELGYGKAIHHVLRHVAELARDTGAVPDAAELTHLVDDQFYLPFADHPGFVRMHSAAGTLVRRYVSDYKDDLKRVWAIERPFELHLEHGILAGRADIILDEEAGKIGSLAIVDYKVAKSEERDTRYAQQLVVYAAAGRGEGLQVDAAYLHELNDGERHSVDISEKPTTEAVQKVSAAMKRIREGHFPASPEAERCKACDYRLVCTHAKLPVVST